jgi:hypothetical protein
MAETIPIGASKSIRECGLNETWLQDQIADNPGCLQLGDLELVSRERQQSTGGRIDMLLKDPQDDSMYEVEVMLGETDESHIIRTIEYWDREKRRWPQRQHFAVLVAEAVTKRFFNVIQLMSNSIPIIAVQVNIVEAEGKRVLHFSKVLDTYEEPEDEIGLTNEKYDEDFWRAKASWTLDAAKALLEAIRPIYTGGTLNFVKNYIAVEVNGNNYLGLHKRSGGKSILSFWLHDSLFADGAALLDGAGISYVSKNQSLKLTVDRQMIESNATLLQKLAGLVKQSWEK